MNTEEFRYETKRKVTDWWNNTKRKANDLVDWALEHPSEALTAAAAIGGVLKVSSRTLRVFAENRRRDLDFYDPRTGRHVWAKRKPTARESVEIDRRYRAGESYEQILWEMRLHG